MTDTDTPEFPRDIWVRQDGPGDAVNLRDGLGRIIDTVPRAGTAGTATRLTALGLDAEGRYLIDARMAASVAQLTDPGVSAEAWLWPVEGKPIITQAWGAAPGYYAQFGLPGHEGLDIRAPHGVRLRAVADGTITRIDRAGQPGRGNYGYSVRLQYERGGVTHEVIYAHGAEDSSTWAVGDRVPAGTVLMLADSTGNVQGAHLHLSLKLLGRTYTDKYPNGAPRVWPSNLHDPTPYLQGVTPPPAVEYARLPEGHALPGVHGPADPGDWAWYQHDSAALRAVAATHMRAVKILVPECSAATIERLRGHGAEFILARLFAKPADFSGATVRDRVARFLAAVGADHGALAGAYAAGVRYLEIHNEPNLVDEGLGPLWNNGREFADFFLALVPELRRRFTGVQLGFPGLSPGRTISGVRESSTQFWDEAQAAVRAADFLCTHAYWGGEGSLPVDALAQVNRVCVENPRKIVLLTEFSNNLQLASKADKGQEYRAFYAGLRGLPPNLGAAFAFCLSSTGEFQHETWLERDGTPSAIVAALAGT